MNRKERSLITKKLLFSTAIKLIKQHGFENISVSDICKQANVAKGTFYVHYQSKEDIIRDSYYLDMNNYIIEQFSIYLEKNSQASLYDQISYFLLLELKFTNFVGLELTSLAFSINLNQCSKGNSNHFVQRKFSNILLDLIDQGITKKLFISSMDKNYIFLYLETMIRGLMASLCFSNANFDIEKTGFNFIKTQLNSIINK